MNKKLFFSLILLMLLFSLIIRIYNLGNIPAGLYIDESSQAYDAYSIAQTGKDQYGKAWPIYLRSFGSFQSPLYTYFSIPFIYFLGPTIFSIRLLSAICGFLMVLITFILLFRIFKEKSKIFIATLFLTIMPWTILFSRAALEANLGLLLFVIGFLFFFEALSKRPKLIYVGMFFMGLSTHAYHAERVVSILFIIGYFILFYKYWQKYKLIAFFGLLLFGLLQVPHLLLISSAGASRRLDQLNYWNEAFFQQNGGVFTEWYLGKYIYIVREFLSQYFSYFSPKSLFFEPDPQLVRSIPELSVFYLWMIIPFFLGIKDLMINIKRPFYQLLFLTCVISPVAAALTRDPFYTLRVLPLFWALSIVIGFGTFRIFNYIKNYHFKLTIIVVLFMSSLLNLYINYFVLLKHERSVDYNYPIIELTKIMQSNKNKLFIVDSPRLYGSYASLAYYMRIDPQVFQSSWDKKILDNYYEDTSYYDSYSIANAHIRPIDWHNDIYKSHILFGDLLSISETQVSEHFLEKKFEIVDLAGKVQLIGYKTHPEKKCEARKEKMLNNTQCSNN